ncbi:hypothetical protein BG004_000917 [Podila humilis]|nr:hypothetical protein BG004_000917 [Podila humilis]
MPASAGVSDPTSSANSTFSQLHRQPVRGHDQRLLTSDLHESRASAELDESWIKITEKRAKQCEKRESGKKTGKKTASAGIAKNSYCIHPDKMLSDESQPDAMEAIDLWLDDASDLHEIHQLKMSDSNHKYEEYPITPNSPIPQQRHYVVEGDMEYSSRPQSFRQQPGQELTDENKNPSSRQHTRRQDMQRSSLEDVFHQLAMDDFEHQEILATNAISSVISSTPRVKPPYLKKPQSKDVINWSDISLAKYAKHSNNIRLEESEALQPEEVSFSHAKGHLIRLITELYPWDEWDQIKALDLSGRNVESVVTLDHLVSTLEDLNLNKNQLSYLNGIPTSVKKLQARANDLSDLTNFGRLINLQYLDISNNAWWWWLKLTNCRVTCSVMLNAHSQRLTFLDVSHNQIEQLDLESLIGVTHFNVERNCIEGIILVKPLPRLRVLRLGENKLKIFDATPFPNLRILYLDNNRLQTLENCKALTRIETLSVRDQDGEGITLDMTEFINIRKLYLSGNPIRSLDLGTGFFHLEYLEIGAGCLFELAEDIGSLMPNLRGLNFSYNSLDSVLALTRLYRLRRLILVGNELKGFSDILLLVQKMPSLTTLDLRHNPLTANMYPAMSLKKGSKYQESYKSTQNNVTEQDWRSRDLVFRRALPDGMYIKRSVYRSAVMKACARLTWFDGGTIQMKERDRIPLVLGEWLDGVGRGHLGLRQMDDDDDDTENAEYDDADGDHPASDFEPGIIHEHLHIGKRGMVQIMASQPQDEQQQQRGRSPDNIHRNSRSRNDHIHRRTTSDLAPLNARNDTYNLKIDTNRANTDSLHFSNIDLHTPTNQQQRQLCGGLSYTSIHSNDSITPRKKSLR